MNGILYHHKLKYSAERLGSLVYPCTDKDQITDTRVGRRLLCLAFCLPSFILAFFFFFKEKPLHQMFIYLSIR